MCGPEGEAPLDISIDEIGWKIKHAIANVISRRVDFSMSKRVLTAMLEDVVEAVQGERERSPVGLSQRSLSFGSGSFSS